MDAPQISTLPDDGESPPSNASPARTGKFRVKLLVSEANMGTKFIAFNGETGEEAGVAEEAEEDEPDVDEEEDELIDEEGEGSTSAAGATKSGTKRPATKLKSSQARRKARLNAPNTAPTSSPAPALSETQGSPAKDVQDAPPSVVEPPSTTPQTTSAASTPTSKKKVVPRGTTAAQRAPRKSAPKPPKTTTAVVPPTIDVAADVSEGHAGTVPSSPAPIDAHTPDPESVPPLDTTSIFAPPGMGAPEPTTIEDIEGVPHPRYPLPTKPFQVQPAPKITTGYAPITPLDRTKSLPRRWRLAHREIRGIAGGRWFARAWVGEKDSELAIAAEAALSLPKLPALSISASAGGSRTPGKRKPKADANSTAASSRSASAAPEGVAPPPPLQRSATKKSALSTAVAASEVEMDIDLVS
jgi:Wiskott-Aldrich syndrome protein